MSESVTIDRARVRDGTEFTLVRMGEDYVVSADGRVLMSSRVHDSEEALADCALERHAAPRAVLVGGLGLGFTLRAVLDRVPAHAMVTVAELVPELVGWNRQHVGQLNDHPLEDPRCEVVVGDVLDVIKERPRHFDVVLLDVDNGPVAISQADNRRLYAEAGLRACRAALRPSGVLAIWSAGPDPRFARRLENSGFDVEVVRAQARTGSRARHVIFMAERS